MAVFCFGNAGATVGRLIGGFIDQLLGHADAVAQKDLVRR